MKAQSYQIRTDIHLLITNNSADAPRAKWLWIILQCAVSGIIGQNGIRLSSSVHPRIVPKLIKPDMITAQPRKCSKWQNTITVSAAMRGFEKNWNYHLQHLQAFFWNDLKVRRCIVLLRVFRKALLIWLLSALARLSITTLDIDGEKLRKISSFNTN